MNSSSGESSSPNNATSTTTVNMLGFQGFHQETEDHQQLAPILSWPFLHPQFQSNNQLGRDASDRYFTPSSLPPFHPLPPTPPPSIIPFYSEHLYSRRTSSALQFDYHDDPLGLASGFYNYVAYGHGDPSPSLPFESSIHSELGKMSTQEIMDAKALAASKSHSEAERRRRERINAHFAKLRSLLPSTTKTDKASLLAEVIQHVKELKRQTSEIAEESPLPTESDELTVNATTDEEGKFIMKASLCCDDRASLLPELIKALKALQLRTLKAEITTLGGRVKNVLVITGDENLDQSQLQQSMASIQEALKAVMERAATSDEQPVAGGIKRQRITNLSTILEHNSI